MADEVQGHKEHKEYPQPDATNIVLEAFHSSDTGANELKNDVKMVSGGAQTEEGSKDQDRELSKEELEKLRLVEALLEDHQISDDRALNMEDVGEDRAKVEPSEENNEGEAIILGLQGMENANKEDSEAPPSSERKKVKLDPEKEEMLSGLLEGQKEDRKQGARRNLFPQRMGIKGRHSNQRLVQAIVSPRKVAAIKGRVKERKKGRKEDGDQKHVGMENQEECREMAQNRTIAP